MGINKQRSIVLGFSGGIDSVTAASILSREGWRVVAVTLDMIGDEPMLERARERAAEMGIEHHTVDVRELFSHSIIDYFVNSYTSGRTPAPCTLCNSTIKWQMLAAKADSLGIEHIATGHYFNVVEFDGRLYVARAKDAAKDQSYYLWGLGQDILRRIVTPMANQIKAEVKRNFSDKSESMGVCFLRGNSYRDFLCRHCASLASQGDVVNSSGEVVGSHDGVAFYTIGQKRGFQLFSSANSGSVVEIDAEHNRLRIGEQQDLLKVMLKVDGCNMVNDNELLTADDVSVVVRGIGRNPEGYIRRVQPISGGYLIELSHPAWATAPGQPVVFYRQNRVIGGGFLRRSY